MLWVAPSETPAVYEGFGTWNKCIKWINKLSDIETATHDWINTYKLLERDQYVMIPCVYASVHQLEMLGFERVDQ